MTKSPEQLEKNVSASFAYVKKDMLMLNDAFSSINDKIQNLTLNHETLLEEIRKLKEQIADKKSDNEELEFYDVKEKKKFKSSNYKLITKSERKFAVATSPTGTESYRIMGSTTKKKTPKTTKKKSTKKKIPTKKKIVKETTTYE